VTDCDIDLSVTAPNALDVYDALLNIFRRAECAGPMLRIHDIPRNYPLYNRVMNRHIEHFWRHEPVILTTSQFQVAIQQAPIDTTFAMHRAGEPFRRLKSGIRVYEPFEALHLDWYQTGDFSIYSGTSSASISHWDNKEERVAYRLTALEYFDYFIVQMSSEGNLEVHRKTISETGSESHF
jgi:hypothetical protein